jgi:hypothetical protein
MNYGRPFEIKDFLLAMQGEKALRKPMLIMWLLPYWVVLPWYVVTVRWIL